MMRGLWTIAAFQAVLALVALRGTEGARSPAWWTPAVQLASIFEEAGDGALETPSFGSSRNVRRRTGLSFVAVEEEHSSLLSRAVKVNNSGAGAYTAAGAGSANGATNAETAVALKVNSTALAAGGVRGKQPLGQQTWWGWVRLTLSFAFVIKALCMLSNVMFQVSPFPLVKTWREKGNTGDANAAPYVCVAYCGSQWCFYGAFAFIVTSKTGFLVLVYSNVVGAFAGAYYVWAFAKSCTKQRGQENLWFYLKIAAGLAGVQACAMFMVPWDKALFFSGLVSSLCSIASGFSLLVTVPLVLRTKCSSSMPFPVLCASLVSAVLWITCGVLLWDPWITVPNLITVSLIGYAFYLIWLYPPDGSTRIEDPNPPPPDTPEGIDAEPAGRLDLPEDEEAGASLAVAQRTYGTMPEVACGGTGSTGETGGTY